MQPLHLLGAEKVAAAFVVSASVALPVMCHFGEIARLEDDIYWLNDDIDTVKAVERDQQERLINTELNIDGKALTMATQENHIHVLNELQRRLAVAQQALAVLKSTQGKRTALAGAVVAPTSLVLFPLACVVGKITHFHML